jgi:ATP-dependent Clp protease ATP-binding subunit ClpC
MFERYTEKARRVIFFARYEASTHGIPEIDTRCLLLGILREDQDLMARLAPEGANELAHLRTEVEALFPPPIQKISTTVDLPLSHMARRALTVAAEESIRRKSKHIEPCHLLWALFESGGAETACLKASGLTIEAVNADLDQTVADTNSLERFEIQRIVDRLPKERLRVAGLLLTGLTAEQFEVSGTGPDGPFHFSFGSKTGEA